MTSSAPDIRKAAIFVRSLDGPTAARLLAQLSPDEVQAVRAAIQELDDVDGEERAEVWSEFRLTGKAASQQDEVTIAPALLADETPADDTFAFLGLAEPANLAPQLAGEHPQTIAVVLAHLEATRAAELLEALPLSLQTGVVERLASLGATDPETLKVLEHELATWVARQVVSPTDSYSEKNHAERILAVANSAARERLLARLKNTHGDLVDQLNRKLKPAVPIVRKQPLAEQKRVVAAGKTTDATARQEISFEQLGRLDTATLSAVLRQVDAEVLKLALVDADESVIDRVTKPLSRRGRDEFRRSLHQIGPTRLADVAQAKRTIAESAARYLQSK